MCQYCSKGYTLYAFNVAQNDRQDGTNTSALNIGDIKLELGFRTATAQNIDLIIYAVYQGRLSIDAHRNVALHTDTDIEA